MANRVGGEVDKSQSFLLHEDGIVEGTVQAGVWSGALIVDHRGTLCEPTHWESVFPAEDANADILAIRMNPVPTSSR